MCVDIKDVSQSKVFFNWAQLLVRVIPLISPSNTPTGVWRAPVCYLGDDWLQKMWVHLHCVCPLSLLWQQLPITDMGCRRQNLFPMHITAGAERLPVYLATGLFGTCSPLPVHTKGVPCISPFGFWWKEVVDWHVAHVNQLPACLAVASLSLCCWHCQTG